MAIKNITEVTKHLMLCNGGTCTQKGANESTTKIRACLQDEGLDTAVHTTKNYCNGRCQDGPVVIVMPEGTWYKQITADKARKFVQQHLVRGRKSVIGYFTITVTMYCTLFNSSVGTQALLAGTLVCAVALVGGVAYFVPDQTLRRFTQLGVSLSVGVLLGDAFLHLLPNALVRLGNAQLVMGGTLGGLLLFFVLEKVVRWQHHHTVYKSGEQSVQAFAPMNLMGDAVHNFIDGTLIAGAFLVSPEAG